MSLKLYPIKILFLLSIFGYGITQRFPSLPDFLELILDNATKLGNNLPSPMEFVENLLNETSSEIYTLSRNFYFRDVEPEDIEFLLFRKNGSFELMKSGDVGKISLKEPTKIVVHGWQSTGDTEFIKDLVKSYSTLGISNVIAVNWQKHSRRNYIHAASCSKNIGNVIGDFILKLVKKESKLLKNVHLIGHSLGAQICGFAGKKVKDAMNVRVGRITALDAAAPIFEFPIKMPAELRISSDDADYVDGVHTNAGFFGFLGPFASADYYFNNGGPIQPGCGGQPNIVDTFFCSHSMSHNIFNKSITTKRYKAVSCPNVALYRTRLCDFNERTVFGEHASTKATGTFFFDE